LVRWLVTSPRRPVHHLRNDAASYAWLLLATGFGLSAATRATHLNRWALGYCLLVFVAFLWALALHFLWTTAYRCYVERGRMSDEVRRALLPLLAAQLFSGLLTMISAYVVLRTGTVGLAVTGVMIVIFQYLVGELLTSKRRGYRLAQIATTDELTGVANRERFQARLEQEIAVARLRRQLPRDAPRPRPLQGDQRHARPPLRRPTAARAGPAAGAHGGVGRARGEAGRRRVCRVRRRADR
jgi:hypothetical protein